MEPPLSFVLAYSVEYIMTKNGIFTYYRLSEPSHCLLQNMMKNINCCITWSLKTKVRQRNCPGTGPEFLTWPQLRSQFQDALFVMSIFHFILKLTYKYMDITEYLEQTKVA